MDMKLSKNRVSAAVFVLLLLLLLPLAAACGVPSAEELGVDEVIVIDVDYSALKSYRGSITDLDKRTLIQYQLQENIKEVLLRLSGVNDALVMISGVEVGLSGGSGADAASVVIMAEAGTLEEELRENVLSLVCDSIGVAEENVTIAITYE